VGELPQPPKSGVCVIQHRFTLGADKAYDSLDLVTTLQAMNVTPHVTQNNKIAAAPLTDGPPGTAVTR
jgi:hypothetical protein